MTGVFIRRREDRQRKGTEGRRPRDDIGRDWSDTAANQGMPKIAGHHPELGRGKDGSEPSELEEIIYVLISHPVCGPLLQQPWELKQLLYPSPWQ